MASRGESKTMKSISAPKARYFSRKKNVFTVKGRPGPHNRENSVPLSFLLRDVLEATKNLRETKAVLKQGKVKVNGEARKDYRLSVGLFDVVEIDSMKKKYRILFDNKGRIYAKEIEFKGKDFKVSKVTGKRKAKGGKTFITTGDGFTIPIEKEKIGVGDSVKISLPERKIEEVYEMKAGSSVFIVGGIHVGQSAKVHGIVEGNIQRQRLVSLEGEGNNFTTVEDNVFVVGKGKPEIEALGK